MAINLISKILRFFTKIRRGEYGLQVRFSLFLASLILVVMFFTNLLIEDMLKATIKKEVNSRADVIAKTLARDSRDALLLGGAQDLVLDGLVSETVKNKGVLYAFIYDRRGVIRAHNDVSQRGQRYDIVYPIKDPKTPHFDIDEPIVFFGQELGIAHIGFSEEEINRAISNLRMKIFLGAFLGLLLGVIGAYFLVSYIIKPINRLVTGVKEIEQGNFDLAIPVTSKDELGELTRNFNRMAKSLKEKVTITTAFNRYVSKEILAEILQNPEKIDVGGQKKTVSIVFIDIRGFTSLSERVEPHRVVELLNNYFEIVSGTANKYYATIDKYIGDGAMLTFNSLVDQPDHALRAVLMAIELRDELKKWLQQNREGVRDLFSFGIGVNTGSAIVGNIGSSSKMDFTAIGSSVNLAARLEAQAHSNQILMSEDTYQHVKEQVDVRYIDKISVKGFMAPVPIYEVTGGKITLKELEIHSLKVTKI